MFRTPVLDQNQTKRLAHAIYTVFQTVCAPAMHLDSVYGIALPTDTEFSATDAQAMTPSTFNVSDPYKPFKVPAFPRLPLSSDIEIVLVAIGGPTDEVLTHLTLPPAAIGLVVASKAEFAGVQSDPTLPVIHDQGYLVAACGADHTYALAGIPERNVFGTIGAEHPDVKSIRAVVNKTCCRIS